MRIGIYGGSFNPPHAGHVDCATAAARQLALDRLIVIPSAAPPHKAMPPNSPTAQERLEMTRIAFRNVAACEVSDIELRRGGESYTIDTLRELKKQFPDAEFYLIIGTDMFLTLSQWYEAEAVMSLATPAVATRTFGMETATAAEAARLATLGVRTEIIVNDTIEISSSKLRRDLVSRNWTRNLDYSVYSFIMERGLYGAKADLDWLRFEAYKMIDSRRILHVTGCEGEAVRLANRWGADVTEAREAAILHDITKHLSPEEQFALCDTYGLALTPELCENPKLLHSHTAAEIAAERFNVSDAVKSAIKWHTTSHADMTLLEKVIYLADYIEPNRKFNGLEELRALAYQNLDAAMLLGLEMTIDDLTRRNLSIDRYTHEAINSLKKD